MVISATVHLGAQPALCTLLSFLRTYTRGGPLDYIENSLLVPLLFSTKALLNYNPTTAHKRPLFSAPSPKPTAATFHFSCFEGSCKEVGQTVLPRSPLTGIKEF